MANSYNSDYRMLEVQEYSQYDCIEDRNFYTCIIYETKRTGGNDEIGRGEDKKTLGQARSEARKNAEVSKKKFNKVDECYFNSPFGQHSDKTDDN